MKRKHHSQNTQNRTPHPPHKNKHKTRKVSLKTLHPKIILQLARQFTQQNPLPTTRGRKPQYPEALLLTLALTMTAHQYSYRALQFWAQVFFPDVSLPSLSTLWYRLVHIPPARWHAFLVWLVVQGIAQERAQRAAQGEPTSVGLVLVDGTGVGYDMPFYQRLWRGEQIRQIASHVKGVVLGYWEGGVIWLVGASLGGAYADEGRLLEGWLSRYGCGVVGSGALLVGDGLYGHRARLLERIEGVGWLPVVRVRDGVWHRVRAGARKRARARAEAHEWALRERYRIEQVFGGFKRAYGSYVECRSLLSAQMRVWGMLVLWNMAQLVNVWGCFFV